MDVASHMRTSVPLHKDAVEMQDPAGVTDTVLIHVRARKMCVNIRGEEGMTEGKAEFCIILEGEMLLKEGKVQRQRDFHKSNSGFLKSFSTHGPFWPEVLM